MEQKRMCAYIPPGGYVEGQGYRASFVFEGEPGHFPTGEWPCPPGGKQPWFWGESIEDANKAAEDYNEKLGLSQREVTEIISSSMFGGQ